MDILEQLRAHPGPDDSVTVQFRTMVTQRHDAATEIERLRGDNERLLVALTTLDTLIDFSEPASDDKPMIFEDWSELNEAFELARAALSTSNHPAKASDTQ